MDRPTQNLIDRARHGDSEAFLAIFEDARPMVFSVAYRIVGANDAEDVTMDTYLRAWKAMPGFSGHADVRTWICRIAHNCAVDYLRKQCQPAAGPTAADPTDVDPGRLPDSSQRSPCDLAAATETQSLVQAALDRLAPEHRTTLLLRLADGLSYAEIAAATGVPLGTVMSRLFNGRRRLRRVLMQLKKEVL